MKKTWWKESVIYQIYPRSFKDSNGDGIGDIRGIISKLDYLNDLGVDIVWLCPVYESPNDDNGYDISNYREIHPEFGTMQDLDELLEGLHNRGMKLIMDLVVNHSSDEHHWFQEAKKSKNNPYRDYYIWRPANETKEYPNNWKSFFGGEAWEYSEETGEFYLHLFTRKQPDLNWDNPRLRQEVYDLMNFWLDKGIDGFRMDVITLISKRPGLPDTTSSDFVDIVENVYANGPNIHQYLQEMHKNTLSKYDVMTVGETVGIKKEGVLDYVGEDRNELSMGFHFGHMMLGWNELGRWSPDPYTLNEFKQVFMEWDQAISSQGWNSIFLGNHDFPRVVSRWGNDSKFRERSSKTIAMLLLTMRGTPYIYQGDEIGMTNVAFDSIEDYNDVEIKNFYKFSRSNGMTEEEIMPMIHQESRDNARTPIQWDSSKNGGFTDGTPWIKPNPNYEWLNVEKDLQSQDSIFQFFKKLIQFRKENKALVYGDVIQIDQGHDQVFAYRRPYEGDEFLVILNMSDSKATIELELSNYTQSLSNSNEYSNINNMVTLEPWVSIVLKKHG